jgi:tRNA-dihydrouridine synthase
MKSPLLDNPFVLAPMAGITDMPFRRLMKKMGAGCVISEFVSAHAVVQQKKKKSRYLNFHQDERPVGIQLFGGHEDMLVEASKILEQLGVDFVDINFGCPVPKVTKSGGGPDNLVVAGDHGRCLSSKRCGLDLWSQEHKSSECDYHD